MKSIYLTKTHGFPVLGLGTFKTEPGIMYNTVKEALNLGYQHIDCAPVYGNQAEIGKALINAINQKIVTREQLWVTSKLWNDNHAPDDVETAIKKTLTELNLDYLDLYLMHWPVAVKKGLFLPEKAEDLISLKDMPLTSTWAAMEKLIDKGLCRHIGVSNFSIKKINMLLDTAKIKPEVNQIELHPYLQQPEMFEFCKKNDIVLTAYSPLGSPDRPERLKETDEPTLLTDPAILSLADKYSVTAAQILIAWLLHKDAVVIPKSTNLVRMKQNLEAIKVKLVNDDLLKIESLNRNYRYYKGGAWLLEGSDYTYQNLWNE